MTNKKYTVDSEHDLAKLFKKIVSKKKRLHISTTYEGLRILC